MRRFYYVVAIIMSLIFSTWVLLTVKTLLACEAVYRAPFTGFRHPRALSAA